MRQGHKGRLAALVVATAYFFTLFAWQAPIASAHHPEIEASSYCDAAGAPVIEYRAYSWLQDPNQDGRSGNPSIGVFVDGQKVATGEFTSANGYEFTGVVDASTWEGQTVTVKVVALSAFNNGSSKGSWRETSVKVPSDCVQPATVLVSVGDCVFDGEVSSTDVTFTLTGGVAVDVTGPDSYATTITQSTTIKLSPGAYSWSATADEGYAIQGPSSGDFVVEDCTPDSASVIVSVGACAYTEGASTTAVTVTITGDATVTITGPDSSESILTETTTLDLGPGSYAWSAEAGEGSQVVGDTSGQFVLVSCEPLGAIGDFVWFDANQDGIQSGGDEIGVIGATVELLQDNVVMATQLTGADGSYLFDQLPAGDYQVRFTAPAGYVGYTTSNVGSDNTDSDAVPTGDATVAVTGIIQLAVGQTDLTNDAGLLVEVEAEVVTTTTTTAPSPTTTAAPEATTTLATVTVDTLPFTGSSTSSLALAGGALLALGALLLLSGSREPVAIRDDE